MLIGHPVFICRPLRGRSSCKFGRHISIRVSPGPLTTKIRLSSGTLRSSGSLILLGKSIWISSVELSPSAWDTVTRKKHLAPTFFWHSHHLTFCNLQLKLKVNVIMFPISPGRWTMPWFVRSTKYGTRPASTSMNPFTSMRSSWPRPFRGISRSVIQYTVILYSAIK